ncbi:MAG TPA: hypothetical protein VGP72_13555 [Planctomycetota bacterium]|jgi:hypothetical protein
MQSARLIQSFDEGQAENERQLVDSMEVGCNAPTMIRGPGLFAFERIIPLRLASRRIFPLNLS